jgi:hypothetical protein
MLRWLVRPAAAVTFIALMWPAAAQAAEKGNDVGKNLADLLTHYAGELYGGIIAAVSLVFLIHRRYGELATFLVASVVVAWMVFSPDQIAHTARSIGDQILG